MAPRLGTLAAFAFGFFLVSPVSNAGESLAIQLGYTNAQGAKVAAFIAKDQGIFEKHGLDIRLERISPGRLGVPKLLSGEIHFFLGNSGPVVEAVGVEKAPLAIIASLGTDRFAIFTRPGITRVEDLKGKTFGVSTPGASQDRIAARALNKLGLVPGKDIRIVATGFNISVERLKSLARGEVDAVAASPDDLPQLDAAQAARVRKLVDLSDVGIYVSGADVAVARKYVQENGDTVKRFLRALDDSLRLAKAKPEVVAAAYKKYLEVDDAQALEKVKEYYAGNPPERAVPDKKAIASHIEELVEKDPNFRPREVSAYIEESGR